MTVKELRQDISRIFRRTGAVDAAMTIAAELLSREFGEVRILTPARRSGIGDRRVTAFLESRAFPFRGAYAPSIPGAASLVMLVGAWGVPPSSMQAVVDHLAQELSLFDERTSTSTHRSEAA